MYERKKILLLGNCYYVIFRFRKELIERLVNEGYEVWVAFPNQSHGEKERGEETAKKIGCNFIELEMERRSANPLKEIKLYRRIKRIICDIKPDCILTYTVKLNLYGGIIAHKIRIPYIINITGLGSALGNESIISRILLKLTLYCMGKASCVFFQNNSDKEYFQGKGFISERACMIPGSGVNIDEYRLLPYPDEGVIRFLYLARVMKEKGIEEYLELAQYFKDRKDMEFHICGDCEEAYEEKLYKLEQKNVIVYHRQVSNVIDYHKMAHCLILPSFYHEGISNSLLEAAACGRPLITTDHPGCREVVEDSVTGYLVEKQNSKDLISKVKTFMNLTYEEKRMMGLASRKKVEREFDRNIVVDMYDEKIKELFV